MCYWDDCLYFGMILFIVGRFSLYWDDCSYSGMHVFILG